MKLYHVCATGVGGRDEKNAMALREINSNEKSNADGIQLLILLPNETTPLQWTRFPYP